VSIPARHDQHELVERRGCILDVVPVDRGGLVAALYDAARHELRQESRVEAVAARQRGWKPDGQAPHDPTPETALDGGSEAQRSDAIEGGEVADAHGQEPWRGGLATTDDRARVGLARLLAQGAVGRQRTLEPAIEFGRRVVGLVVGDDGQREEVGLNVPGLAGHDADVHTWHGSEQRGSIDWDGRGDGAPSVPPRPPR